MAETNGDIPLTGDPRVDAALARIRGKFRDLEDAMVVQAHLEKRQSESIKALAEGQDLIHQQQDALRQQQESIRQQQESQRKLNSETDKRISDLVSAIGELIGKRGASGQAPA